MLACSGALCLITGCTPYTLPVSSGSAVNQAGEAGSLEPGTENGSPGMGTPTSLAPSSGSLSLEEQLSRLEALGVKLNPGITVDDLLYSHEREEYEAEPFDLLLFVLGVEVEREPWGRFFSDNAWNLDTECIEDVGSYADIVENLCRIAGNKALIFDVSDTVDIMSESGKLEYTVGGVRRSIDVEIDNDWADPATVTQIMSDIEEQVPGRHFYGVDNGQASIWYFLTKEQADTMKSWGVELAGGS